MAKRFLMFALGGLSSSASSSSRNVWVSGLSSNTKAADLKNLFGKYGKVKSHFVFKMSYIVLPMLSFVEYCNVGFCQFETPG